MDDLAITVTCPRHAGRGGRRREDLDVERGGFDEVNAALMVHPAPNELDHMPCLAVEPLRRPLHRQGSPRFGISPSAASTRPTPSPSPRSQSAFSASTPTRSGPRHRHLRGAAPNVVPGLAVAKFYVRGETLEAALALGAEGLAMLQGRRARYGHVLEIVPQGPAYSEFRTDEQMAVCTAVNAESIGRAVLSESDGGFTASTDMGERLARHSLHPSPARNRFPARGESQAAFADAAIARAADRAVRDGALAMAWTVIDLASDAHLRERLAAKAYRHP